MSPKEPTKIMSTEKNAGSGWKNTALDNFPEHEQNVLISVEGVYYMTIYDANQKVFRLTDDLNSTFDPAEFQSIYWLPIDQYPQKKNPL